MSGPTDYTLPPPDAIKDVLSYEPESGRFVRVVGRKGNAAGGVVGTTATSGYTKIGFGGRIYSAHRLAWFFFYGVWPEHAIDHKNGIRSDNRLCNLRKASVADNNRNRRPEGKWLKGVTQHKRTGRYHAFIRAGGKRHFLGSFATEAEAYATYCEAAHRLHGEFARVE